MADYEYPRAAGPKAQPEVQEAVERYREEVSEEEKERRPLLYWLLGSGTPPYKMGKEESEYVDETSQAQKCANCRFAYQKVIDSKRFICSQIDGFIKPAGTCKLWRG